MGDTEATRTYRLTRVDAETARRLARAVDRYLGIDEVYVRGIADAVRVGADETPSFLPEEPGYFETTVNEFEDALGVLPSLTRFVAYTASGSAVFSWREDGGVYLRAEPDGKLLDAMHDEGLEPEEASGMHEGVLAEDEGNRKAEEERKNE
jgi:hypothetical protein